MIFRECGINAGCKKLEIEFEKTDTFAERQVAYSGFELIKALLQLARFPPEAENDKKN